MVDYFYWRFVRHVAKGRKMFGGFRTFFGTG